MAELCVTFSVLLNTFLYIRMFYNELTCFCSKKSTYSFLKLGVVLQMNSQTRLCFDKCMKLGRSPTWETMCRFQSPGHPSVLLSVGSPMG